MHPNHPLAGKKLLVVEDLDHCTVGTNAPHLMRQLQLYVENTGLHTHFIRIKAERHDILEACNTGAIALMNEDVVHTFPAFFSAPLDFDMGTDLGFACRAEMYEVYQPFFQVARKIKEQETGEDQAVRRQNAGQEPGEKLKKR